MLAEAEPLLPGRGIELSAEPEVASHDTEAVKGHHPIEPDRAPSGR